MSVSSKVKAFIFGSPEDANNQPSTEIYQAFSDVPMTGMTISEIVAAENTEIGEKFSLGDGTIWSVVPAGTYTADAEVAIDLVGSTGQLYNTGSKFPSRTLQAVQALYRNVEDLEIGYISGIPIKKYSLATGSDSITNDLGQDGFIPAHSEVYLSQWGVEISTKDLPTDQGDKIRAALAWVGARVGYKLKPFVLNFSSDVSVIGFTGMLDIGCEIDMQDLRLVPMDTNSGIHPLNTAKMINFRFDTTTRPLWDGTVCLFDHLTNSGVTAYPEIDGFHWDGYDNEIDDPADPEYGIRKGTFIKVDSDTGASGTSRLARINAINLRCTRANKVLHFVPRAGNLNGWLNSNTFEFITIFDFNDCFICDRVGSDSECTNNIISAESIQPNTSLGNYDRAIKWGGRHNSFFLNLWDWSSSVSECSIEILPAGRKNKIKGSYGLTSVRDHGDRPSFLESKGSRRYPIGNSGTDLNRFCGHQSNGLAFANRFGSVSSSTPPDTGAVANVVGIGRNALCGWDLKTSVDVDFDLGSAQSSLIAAVINFSNNKIPDRVRISRSDDGVAYTEVASTLGSGITFIGDEEFLAGTFQHLRFTFENDVAGPIQFSQIGADWKTNEGGAWATKYNPRFEGDIKLGGKDIFYRELTTVNGSITVNANYNRRTAKLNGAPDRTITINSGQTHIGQVLEFIRGGGEVTVVAGAGVTIRSPNGLRINEVGDLIRIFSTGTNTYSIIGNMKV